MNIMSPSQRKELRLELAVLLQQAMLLGGGFFKLWQCSAAVKPLCKGL